MNESLSCLWELGKRISDKTSAKAWLELHGTDCELFIALKAPVFFHELVTVTSIIKDFIEESKCKTNVLIFPKDGNILINVEVNEE